MEEDWEKLKEGLDDRKIEVNFRFDEGRDEEERKETREPV